MEVLSKPNVALEDVWQLRKRGHLGAAYETAKTAFAISPTSIHHWAALCDLAMKRDSVGEVERLLQVAPADGTRDDLRVLCAKAELARRRNRHDEAHDLLQRALKLAPDHPGLLSSLFYLSIRNNALGAARGYYLGLRALRRSAHPAGRRSNSPLESFDDQIMNDMALDSAVMAQLDEMRHMPTAARITALLRLIRSNPDHIPTANMIAVSLREGGYLSLRKVSGNKNTSIPKTVCQYWESSSVPDDLRASCESWREWNSDWFYRCFNDVTALRYLNDHFPSDVVAAFGRSCDASTKADLLRLAVLARDGGVWVDVGNCCQQALESILSSDTEALFWQEQTGHIGSNFIAARPGHPVLQRALALAVESVNRGDQEMAWLRTGPGLLTRAFAISLSDDRRSWRGRLATLEVIDEFEIWRQVAPVSLAASSR